MPLRAKRHHVSTVLQGYTEIARGRLEDGKKEPGEGRKVAHSHLRIKHRSLMTLSQAEVNQLNICSNVCYCHRLEQEHTHRAVVEAETEGSFMVYIVSVVCSVTDAEVLLWL